ncbi:L-rhamnose mutarotase [Prolixibacteraceae bacterium JC049]|nr:L-rhamnose mutarotase [Prolixibacteraceae bacterium JC049]
MKRYCKQLDLKNDASLIDAYELIHAKGQVWTEITEGMKVVGILDMEIYRIENRLFMIMDTEDHFEHEKAMTQLAMLPRQKEWEEYVSQFQKTESDSASEKWQLMKRIYKMD